MFLGLGHRQLNVNLPHFAVEFFNKKIRGFAHGERQVVWGENFPSTGFEQEIARPYAGRKGWTASMHVLEHPVLTSVYADTLQSRVDRVASGNIPHPRMPKAGVTGLEFSN